MNIKEIALKIAPDYWKRDQWNMEYFDSVGFAEALIAEIAKQNDPVVDVKIPLYIILPPAEQIANETAEAIAKMLESGSFLSTESKVALAANGAAKAIRRGAWKEFKK